MFGKILVAVDTSENHRQVFDTALAIAKSMKADLMVLHVLSTEEQDSPALPALTTIDYYSAPTIKDVETYQEQWRNYEEQGLVMLRSLTTEATQAGVAAEFRQNSGSPGRKVCEVAQDWGAELIVVGRRGHSGLDELLLGSVSNYVLHRAPCSVLAVQGVK